MRKRKIIQVDYLEISLLSFVLYNSIFISFIFFYKIGSNSAYSFYKLLFSSLTPHCKQTSILTNITVKHCFK